MKPILSILLTLALSAAACADVVGTFTAGGITSTTLRGAAGQSSIGRTADGTQQRGILFSLPAPAISVSLAPAAPKTNDTLTATALAAPAGEPYSFTYVWTKTTGGTTTTVKTTSGTASATDTLDLSVAGNGDVGDTIRVTVTAVDTRTGLSAAPASQSVTVANTPPTIDLDSPNHNYAATFTQNSGGALVENANTLTVGDADNTPLAGATVTITNLQDGAAESLSATTTGTNITATYTQNGTTGTLTLSGADSLTHYQQVLRTVRFNDTAPQPNVTARTISFVANDGTASSQPATTTLTVVIAPTPTPVPGTNLSVGFSNVGNGDIYRGFPTLLGSVMESNAPPTTTYTVQVSIQRGSDGKYFDGEAWSATPTFFPATVANGTFVLPAGVLPSNAAGQNVADSQYTLTAVATDNSGQRASATITLTIDHTAPTIKITTPALAATVRQLQVIGGTATDAKGGTGVQKVLVSIVRVADGKDFNGTTFVTPPKVSGVPQTVMLNANYDPKFSNWALRQGLVGNKNFTPGNYRILAVAVDGAGNRGQATSSFTVPEPASATALSTAVASVATNTVTLRFTVALHAESASDAANYTVTVNGQTVKVDSAGYNSSNHGVALGLPEGTLKTGDKVVVTYRGLSDSKGNAVAGQTGALTAR
ncbi:MAG: hypothetical protein JOZ57_14480 [Abitibacteriaceae bacterium]|nr:hypothetical protein [Abditibacteriaceae bacterium]